MNFASGWFSSKILHCLPGDGVKEPRAIKASLLNRLLPNNVELAVIDQNNFFRIFDLLLKLWCCVHPVANCTKYRPVLVNCPPLVNLTVLSLGLAHV